MPYYTPIYFSDGTGSYWSLSVDENGRLTRNKSTSVNPAWVYDRYFLRDAGDATKAWQMYFLPTGQMEIDSLTVPQTLVLATGISLKSPGGKNFRFQVANSVVEASDLPADVAGPSPVVGQIFDPDTSAYIPHFGQPGGPSTPTVPAQQPGEMLGLFVAGCGHWFNSWDITSAGVAGTPGAVIRCPMCSYVQRIIVPYSDIHTFQNEIVLA